MTRSPPFGPTKNRRSCEAPSRWLPPKAIGSDIGGSQESRFGMVLFAPFDSHRGATPGPSTVAPHYTRSPAHCQPPIYPAPAPAAAPATAAAGGGGWVAHGRPGNVCRPWGVPAAMRSIGPARLLPHIRATRGQWLRTDLIVPRCRRAAAAMPRSLATLTRCIGAEVADSA